MRSGDGGFDGAGLRALVSVGVDGGHGVVIGAAVRDGRIVVERGGYNTGIDLTQRGCAGAAINVISGKIVGGGSGPVQVDDVVRGWLNDDLVGHLRIVFATGGHRNGERIGRSGGGSSGEGQRCGGRFHRGAGRRA